MNGRASNAGTLAAPFQTAWQAAKFANPGDTIYVLPTITYTRLSVVASGAPGLPITVKGTGLPPNRTRIAGIGTDSAVWINADYVTVSNFDASAAGQNAAFSVAPRHHHVTLSGNVAHDSGAAGITTFSDDYVTITGNTVFGNAHDTSNGWQNSGISLLGPVDVDGYTGVKMRVTGNVIYANTNLPGCARGDTYCLTHKTDSDGSGIILDDFLRKRFDSIAYRGRTLIANNVVFGNGGRGIYMYRSLHATIIENTVWSNNQDPFEGNWHPGEIGLNAVGDVSIYNNILVGDGRLAPNHSGTAPNTHVSFSAEYCATGVGQLIVRHNLMYALTGGSGLAAYTRDVADPITFADNWWADPVLRHPSLDPATADFRPRVGSVVLNNGEPVDALPIDMLTARRAGNTSFGAFETPDF